MYDQIGKGGNDNQWLTLTMYLYNLAWGDQKSLGRGSAVAIILFIIILIFALISFNLTKRIASSAMPQAKTRHWLGKSRTEVAVKPSEAVIAPEGVIK